MAFTGAGISTESGIPDFRGPQGIWKKMRPIELSEFLQDPQARREYWRRKVESYPQMRDAKPNAGHRALAWLFDELLQTVITQNIDSVILRFTPCGCERRTASFRSSRARWV